MTNAMNHRKPRAAMACVLACGLGACFQPDGDRPVGGLDDTTEGETIASTDSMGDATTEPSSDDRSTDDPTSGGTSSPSSSGMTTNAADTDDAETSDGGSRPICSPGEVFGCDGDDLVTCNAAGTGEIQTTCSLGCNDAELRCYDIDPSNELAEFLDGAEDELDFELVGDVTIDTDTGAVSVNDVPVSMTSFLTGDAPPVRVFVVGSLVTGDVTVIGTNALAIVSDDDIRISGHFSVSARSNTAGPGASNNATCVGKDTQTLPQTISGAGGGGFGSPGGKGGSATNQGTAQGGAGGGTTGNATLTPLRGGCDSGIYSGSVRGRGGGAAQLVSRTAIIVEGILSANGSSYAGGGSGGGILLEAPLVEVSGNVVANGGAGAGGGFLVQIGEHGRTDAQPATGGIGADTNAGNGGNGAAGATGAQPGQSINQPNLVFGGHGGGGLGRIRVNTPPGGTMTTGVYSPNPTSGPLKLR